MEAGFGAVFGLAVQWGVKEGFILASQGTAPHIAAAANVSHLLNKVSPIILSFIDTLLVCSATVLITGKYNVQNPVLGADGATQFYTKEQKMFLLVPDYTICNG
jgi:AGCS family alanine or glycine:cation symporter